MSRRGHAWPDEKRKPCGTSAAIRRHYRRGEPLCDACRLAEHEIQGITGDMTPDTREVRNDLPVLKPYRYGGAAAWRASAGGAKPC